MARCFVLGAGFSKAVSNLPVMKELADAFWDIRSREDRLGHCNRVRWGDRIQYYLQCLEYEFFEKPCVNTEDGETYRECNFQENLEALVSFIDLNASGKIEATVTDKNGRTSSYSKGSLFWNFTDLDELRSCIETYIYLTLIRPKVKKYALVPFLQKMESGDEIITFNYDLIVERAIFQMGIWKPRDGYGVDFKDFPPIDDSHDIESRVMIHKLHGSLNWKSDFSLRFFYDDNEPIFPGYLRDRSSGHQYQGKHSGNWMLPSFIKRFTVPELIGCWDRAFRAMKDADEIVIIGYSLPKEDSAACLLLGTTALSEKRMTLVDPNADKLQRKYRTITSNRYIDKYCRVEDFVNAS